MATIRQRFIKWRETRSVWQKTGDILFWMLLLLLIIPGPRKVISTSVNRVILHLKRPAIIAPEEQVRLQERDFDWTLYNLRGDLLTMDAFRGKVIFLNFWATWCPPCVAELPEIAGAYEKHGDQVVFLLVTSEEPEKVTVFLNKRGYDLPVYFTAGPAPRTLDATALPTTFIISKEGKIVSRKTGAANWDSGATTRIFDRLTRCLPLCGLSSDTKWLPQTVQVVDPPDHVVFR